MSKATPPDPKGARETLVMKRLGLALAAAAALSALPLAAPTAAWAQRIQSADRSKEAQAQAAAQKGGAAAAGDAKVSAADKARGAKEAPALVAASDVKTCQVTDSAFRGSGSQKDAQGKAGKFSAYEVACQQGPGYLVIAAEGQPKPQMINCIIAADGATKCVLPSNTDFKAALAPYVRQTGRACEVSGQRYVGSSTASGQTYYEVGCGAGAGFVMAVSDREAKPPEVTDCLTVQGTSQACQLTTKAQMLAAYQPAIAKSGKACQISDVRSIGASKDTGDNYTEIACGASPGFVLVQDRAGAFKTAVDCGKAEGIGGGCKMTDVTTAQTADSAAYTKLAAKAGFPCNVKQYRFIGTDAQNREVVELACSDRPDGAMAVFSETGKSDIYDCVRAPALGGQACKLSQASVVYPKYTEALAAKGRSTCKVSGAGFLGRTTTNVEYVETACADGAPGWVIGFKAGTTTADELLTCKQANNAGLPCKLPTNTSANKG